MVWRSVTTVVTTLALGASAARRSWVLRGVIHGFSEEARTRGFASPALAGFAFIDVTAINAGRGESRQFGEVLKTGVGLRGG